MRVSGRGYRIDLAVEQQLAEGFIRARCRCLDTVGHFVFLHIGVIESGIDAAEAILHIGVFDAEFVRQGALYTQATGKMIVRQAQCFALEVSGFFDAAVGPDPDRALREHPRNDHGNCVIGQVVA